MENRQNNTEMKSILAFALALLVCTGASAQRKGPVNYVFTEASELNLIGKIMDGTPNPYHRVDTVIYKGFTSGENTQLRCSAGLAVLFKTDSPSISVKTRYGYQYAYPLNATPNSYRGYDLYIKKDGRWAWAGAGSTKYNKSTDNVVLVKDMDASVKECMLYLPVYSEVYSVGIGIEEGSHIEAIESPFRHRIAFYGSSYTQGVSTSRGGMSYPMQFMRATGLQVLSLGCSGNAKMQPYFADVLCDVEADAFVFDVFSNPRADMIEERLFPFIEKIRAAHPGVPLIFQQTIHRDSRNFNLDAEKVESDKMRVADSLMRIAVKRYDDVYYIIPDASGGKIETQVDGVHPGDYGYGLWAESIRKPVLKILRKYGIK